MLRPMLVLALSCVAASVAVAKDLCIQQDSGPYAGSQVVLKKVRLGKRKSVPLQGYLAVYSGASGFVNFKPVDGHVITNSKAYVVLGMTLHQISVSASSIGSSSSPAESFVLGCFPGPDEVINELDICSGAVGGASTAGHVVDCTDIVALP